MNLKKPATFDEQIKILRESHHMQIDDITDAKSFLSQCNYYRFSGYAISFRNDSLGKSYCPNTKFSTVKAIYQFDAELRSLLHSYLEKVEIFARTQISYWFSIQRNKTPPYTAHYDEAQFKNKKQIQEIHSCLKKEECRNGDIPYVQHHKKKYNDKMPLWVMVGLLSFGNLSKLYNSMYYSEKTSIASGMGTTVPILKNHLLCLSKLRNKCAHYSRLYGEDVLYNPPAMLPPFFLKYNPTVKTNTLFAYLLILIKRQPTREDKKRLSNELISVIKKYEDHISFKQIGVPDNYKDVLNFISK